jgi:hypothetical protein
MALSAAAAVSAAFAVGALGLTVGIFRANGDNRSLAWWLASSLFAIFATALLATIKLGTLLKSQRSARLSWLSALVADVDSTKLVLALVAHNSHLNSETFPRLASLSGPDDNVVETYRLLVKYDALGQQVKRHYVELDDVRFLLRDFELVMLSPWVRSYLSWRDEAIAPSEPAGKTIDGSTEDHYLVPRRSHDGSRWLLEYVHKEGKVREMQPGGL